MTKRCSHFLRKSHNTYKLEGIGSEYGGVESKSESGLSVALQSFQITPMSHHFPMSTNFVSKTSPDICSVAGRLKIRCSVCYSELNTFSN